jgi:hypothetical protein
MEMKIIEEPFTAAAELAYIPIAFEVESIFDVPARDESHWF